MKINILTTTEETIMLTIWKLGEPFTKDILGALPDPKMHPNTLSTFLKILTDKGFLKTEKIGRIFKYIPIISFEKYRLFILKGFIQNYCNQSESYFLEVLREENILPKTFENEKKNLTKNEDENIAKYLIELTEGKKKKKKKKKNKG